jgi:hypothetical protein
MLATIGRAAGVADFGKVKLSGFLAWLLWLFVHVFFLIGFRNRILVMIQWAWSYLTYDRGARLITGRAAGPLEDGLTTRPLPVSPAPATSTRLERGGRAMDDERRNVIRQVRQRLEALRRAGLDRIPRPSGPARASSPLRDGPGPPLGRGDGRSPAGPSPLVEGAGARGAAGPGDDRLVVRRAAARGLGAARGRAAGRAVDPGRRGRLLHEVPLLASSRTRTVFGEGTRRPG